MSVDSLLRKRICFRALKFMPMAEIVRRWDCGETGLEEGNLYWISPVDLCSCTELPHRDSLVLHGPTHADDPRILEEFRFVLMGFQESGTFRLLKNAVLITTPAILDDAALKEMGFTLPADSITMKQSASAMKMGAVGVVVRPHLATRIRRTFGRRLLIFSYGHGGDGPVDYWIEPPKGWES